MQDFTPINHPAWPGWLINYQGELYHQDRPKDVFTAGYLSGLQYHFLRLADERSEIRGHAKHLEQLLQARQPLSPPSNVVIFPFTKDAKRRKSK